MAFRSTFPSLGDNGLDISFGRQNIVIGDGFLVAGDSLNLGKGIAEGTLNRGGAYYLTGRKDFDQTAVLRVGGASGLRSDLMWLQSDNPAQAKAGLAVATLENVTTKGTIGLTYLEVTNTDKRFDYLNRDGTKHILYADKVTLDTQICFFLQNMLCREKMTEQMKTPGT